MAVLSRMAFDARAAVPADDLPAGTDVQLRMATRVSAESAREWAAKKPADGQITALVDLPDAARLNVAAWLEALQPDVVELRTPAWSEVSMAAIEWPEGLAVLHRVLGALAASQVTTRLALHVSALTLPDLLPAALDTLAQQTGTDALTLMLRPVLGQHAPRLDLFAQAAVALWQSGHTVKGTRLLPACALPEGVDCEPTYASERAAAKQDYTPECNGCPAREEGRCDGMPADLLRASVEAGVTWTGWPTFATDREPVVIVNEPDDTLEEIALRLGIRRVWRSELPLEEAEVLAAHPPEGLIVLAGSHVTLDPQSALQFDTPGSTAQILYLAQEQMDAEAARSADMAAESGDPERVAAAHRDLAKLLGYPDCCAEAFVVALNARQEASAQGLTEHAFAVLQAARASTTLDRRLNFGSPIDDACLVRHVVCSYDCAASLAQVAEMENELSVIAPGRLATKLALRVDGALVFADSAHLPVRGELAEDGSLRNPVVLAEWNANTPRGKMAQRAYEAIADQLAQAVAIAASQPIGSSGGVTVTLADGTQVQLDLGDLPTHAEFPRLLVFAADPA